MIRLEARKERQSITVQKKKNEKENWEYEKSERLRHTHKNPFYIHIYTHTHAARFHSYANSLSHSMMLFDVYISEYFTSAEVANV